ncbi:MAG: efflux RND transporter permease subunit [Myxococcota bacterium]
MSAGKFNLSDWALGHRSYITYFMVVFGLFGVFAYRNLGRAEDPSFTIKTMVIVAKWPGASVSQITEQVCERIEKKLEELQTLDYTRSITTAGETTIFVNLKDATRGRDVTDSWVRVRNIIADIKPTLPRGVYGPFFNDDFGDVYGNIYAFTGDGLTRRQLRDYVEEIRRSILTIPNAGKVQLLGAEDEVIYLEFSPAKLAAFGIDEQVILTTLSGQNAIVPSGTLEAGSERIRIDVSGQFDSEESIRNINLRINDRFFRLADLGTVTRGYRDPPSTLFRFNGQPAIGLAIGMRDGGNLLEFGERLDVMMQRLESTLPIGVGVHLVSDQPQIVEEAVGHFTQSLFEAVVIVLIVSFISLGLRAGLVVALSIPLVLAITFVFMQYANVGLQRISLGALIIALGLLVDDAMIAVEMMVTKLEEGEPLTKAATAVYTSTAFPMLTGTIVTVAGFIPVGLNSSGAGEYTFSLFIVVGVSLMISWVVAVVFSPLIGVAVLPKVLKHKHAGPSRFARVFRSVLLVCMRHRWLTIGATVAAFAISVFCMKFVQQQFFPSSDRSELLVDFTLPQSASVLETKAQMDRFEHEVLDGNPDIVRYSSYVGQGAVRFILPLDVQLAQPFFGQVVIVSKDVATRDALKPKLKAWLTKTFPGTDVYIHFLELGPPVGRPVQHRVSGPDPQQVRAIANKVADIYGKNPYLEDTVFDWNEASRVVKVEVLQDKARQLGISSQAISSALNTVVGGDDVTQVLDSIYLVSVVVRANVTERTSIEQLRNLQLPTRSGASVPLESIANFRYEVEQPLIRRRGRQPTITVKADVAGIQPPTAMAQLQPEIDTLAATLPPGYAIAISGAVEESAKSQAPMAAVVPFMIFVMATVLMTQLQSFSRLFLVFAVAPLALIGVVAALLPSGKPLGFVAILGVLALIGILIRNSVILVVQIEEHRESGMDAWTAVVDATEHRTRPILLTAIAASLALIPIARQVFWGPMAYAMMGGIIVGTVLTLLFLPALYVAWFRIREPAADATTSMAA